MSDNKTLASLVDLLSRTAGRDKLCRTIQYATRFLAAHRREKAQLTPIKEDLIRGAVKLEALGDTMAITRKVLRFGRPLDLLLQVKQTMLDIESGKINNVPKAVVTVLSQIFLCLFFLFDHVLFFSKIGWVNDVKLVQQADYLSNLFWLLECVFSLIKCALEQNDITSLGVSFSEKKRIAKKIKWEVAKNLIDIPVAYGFLYPGAVSSKVMGALGTVTSVIGIYQAWR